MPVLSTPARGDALRPSIALSVRIAPSRRLRQLLALAALLPVLAAGAVLRAPHVFAWPGAVAATCLASAAWLARAAWRGAKARQIDVSGVGEIRLTVQQSLPRDALGVRLLPGSALWPRCLVLRLAEADGSVHDVVVLPDSVADGRFRALSVALRSVGGRGRASVVMQKIL